MGRHRLIARGRTLFSGRAEGSAVRLTEPLSFWGGFDARTGAVIDHRHPQNGQVLTARVVTMPSGRGSSSSSSVLAEAIRLGTAPAAIVLNIPDGIIVLGALVAAELYGTRLPIVVAQGFTPEDGARVVVDATGAEAILRFD